MSARRNLVSLLPLVAASACMMQQPGTGPQPAPIVLRVIAPDSASRTGSLLLVGGDSLLLYDPRVKERFVVRESFAGALEVYRGHQAGGLKPAAKGAGKGALIGAGIGALFGGVVATLTSGSSFWEPVDAGKAVASGALLGAAEGASIGALQGAMRGDAVWERVTFWQLRQELCRCDNPKRP
jgi:hypothetical protein